ncbi:serine hydrolase [Bacillus seohaeanensis]|jgi:serine-type D-Ala-D-Ala carboxypeptidase (penicillin-binding protein 5/6)|uniref:serine-type D-Ala-D-Ala carboxypeptidase n=1 Tax=Bacillus seohaeanensis TaxID=284580 RepID=A0ABW5RPL7_9BACI
MKLLKKNIAVFLLTLIAFVYVPQSIHAEEKLPINADAAILVEADTGKIIYEQNADKALGIASMTKMMTEYLLFEAIESGKVEWEQTYTPSEKVYTLSTAPGLSNVPLRPNEQYTVKELYEAMVIKSANGAAIAISEIVAGSEGEFVKMMNQKAKDLGLEHYQFVNSTGLSNYDMLGMYPKGTGVNDENLLSAQDTATLAYHLMKDFPEVLDTTSLPTKKFRQGTAEEMIMNNTNAMLKGRRYSYEGVDGLKTGTTPFAGSTFTGTAKRDGTRYITVVMDSKNELGQPSGADRFKQAADLFDYGFNHFTTVNFTLDDLDKKDNHSFPIAKGKEEQVKMQTKESIQLLLEKEAKDSIHVKIKMDENKLNEDGELQAPIKKGEKIGELFIENPKKSEYLMELTPEKERISIYAADSVEKANWFVLTTRAIGEFFEEVF